MAFCTGGARAFVLAFPATPLTGAGTEGADDQMMTDDQLAGIRKADMTELKELKVKLPVQFLINLHYLKLTQSKGISDVVNQALTEYFAAQSLPTRPAPVPQKAA